MGDYMRGYWFGVLAVALCLSACGGGGSKAGGGESSAGVTLILNLDFERVTTPADGRFKAVVWLSNAAGAVTVFPAAPALVASRGSASGLSLRGDGKLEATITPDAALTGEYPVSVSASFSGAAHSVTHTAIVLGQVASGWGQAFMVDGLVNTGGTQDSLAVSPDGEYLFLQYYPVSLSCILSGDPDSAYCQNPLGPVNAPMRPGMPGANRVSAGAVHHGCPSIGFDPSPVPVPPIALYGFHRQGDGSYAEPFVFSFSGGDGCFAPWGPSLHINGDGTYRMTLAFNDPRNSGTASDFAHLHSLDFVPGSNVSLGTVSNIGGFTITGFPLAPLSFAGADTHRGNPHVYYSGSTPTLLFFDDETRPATSQYIWVSSWTGSNWSTATPLNFPDFNADGYGNTQPFFDGMQLILRDGLQLLRYGYNGGPVTSASSWNGPTVLLAPGMSALTGTVIVVGEPTIATIAGRQVLYFVYGIRQADGSVNIRAGYIRQGV